MILAVAREGRAVASPLFGAVKLTPQLFDRLRGLSELCSAHRLEMVTLLDLDPPVYWSVAPGDDLCGFIEEHTRWAVLGKHHRAELWGRRRLPDGSYSEAEMMGVTPLVLLDEMSDMRSRRTALDLWELEDSEAVLGTPFLVAVHERMAALKLWPASEPPP
jgi:hypothetical protein